LHTCGGARDDNQSEACVGRSPKVLSCHKPHNNQETDNFHVVGE
jgi:hypothetical protein